MEPLIKTLSPKKLVGMQQLMSLAQNKTPVLWKSFMQQRRHISNALGPDLYSIQVYNGFLEPQQFNPQTLFQKWAAAEVSDFNSIPAGMQSFTLPGGLYAVFMHKGAAATGAKTFHYIFSTWLPASEYVLDDRPHFEILGEKYKNNDPASEEEIWIPIKKKE
ncbi:MAG: GyrI-like domain-containing protein [Bacteroidia bacterium]